MNYLEDPDPIVKKIFLRFLYLKYKFNRTSNFRKKQQYYQIWIEYHGKISFFMACHPLCEVARILSRFEPPKKPKEPSVKRKRRRKPSKHELN